MKINYFQDFIASLKNNNNYLLNLIYLIFLNQLYLFKLIKKKKIFKLFF